MTLPDLVQHLGAASNRPLRLKPALPAAEIARFEKLQPAPLSPELRQLLLLTAGLDASPFGEIVFAARERFGFAEIVPCGFELANDGCGNSWVVDVNPSSGAWGATLFLSHDPPVVAVQAPDLASFIEQAANGDDQARRRVTAATHTIWKSDPGLLPRAAALNSGDEAISAFARALPEDFAVSDLRARAIGSGFSWGRAKPETIRRHASELIFGVQARRSRAFWQP